MPNRVSDQRQYRNEVLAARVEDIITIGVCKRATRNASELEFVRHVIYVARKRGLRLWKIDGARNATDDEAMVKSGHQSLQYLLNEATVQGVKTYNVNWVLDLWEAALDDLSEPIPLDRTDEELEKIGVERELDPADLPARQSMSMGLLKAWITRDEDAFLALVSELETRGL